MSISGIGDLLGSGNASAAYKVGLGSNTIRTSSSSSSYGDTVDISDEAKKLFSEKIHMYDRGSSTTVSSNAAQSDSDTFAETADGDTETSSDSSTTADSSSKTGGAGGGGGGGGSSSNSVEQIKKQIESLKSQLTSVTSQAGSDPSGATESKIQSLEAQIATLEAQLAEAESSS